MSFIESSAKDTSCGTAVSSPCSSDCSCAAPVVVTLDGPAGVGKSTLAKRLAAALGVAYLDTGAMFRTIALGLARSNTTLEGEPLHARLGEFVFALQGSGESTKLLCNGTPVGQEIRSEEAGMMAAKVAQISEVREFLKEAQQRLGAGFSLVAEGRDMGTVVFPQARCKLFLDASPEIRAERRYKQLRAMGKPCDLAELAEQIRQRDTEDRTRALAPLKPADDARIIDTSGKNIDVVFAEIMQAVG